jgi:hypothetical protein
LGEHPISVLTVQGREARVVSLIGDFLPLGGMAEWFKAAVLKTVVPFVAEPWVRILLPPPKQQDKPLKLWAFSFALELLPTILPMIYIAL